MLHRDDFQGLLHGVLRRSGGRSVHALSGDIDLITGDALVTRVREIADGANPFDLDMADVAFIDPTGLRSLFRLHDVVTARGGRLRLLHPSETVMRQLELTHTADQFEIVRTAPGDAGAR